MNQDMQSNIGNWYRCPELPNIFEVVAVDNDKNSIEIQYFDGEIEEIEHEIWQNLHPKEIAAPGDWSGPYEMNREDLETYVADINPSDWNNPLNYVDSTALDWHENNS